MLGVQQSQIKSNNRFYLRYHNSITRAIELNKLIFGNKMSKDGIEPSFEHSLRVAGSCESILDQTMQQYHQGWLLGILHDNKQNNPTVYSQKIDYVLQDLLPQQQKQIKEYVDQLTSDKSLSKGEQKREQLSKAQKLKLIPSWILLFDKYDNCQRFKKNPCKKSTEELNGYFAVAYLIYLTLTKRHRQIRDFLIQETHDFYLKMGEELGGEEAAIKYAKNYFKSVS